MEQPISEMLENFCANGDFVGVSVLAAKDGKVICRGEAGAADLETGRPVSRNTIFHLYSMSKPITSAAIMKLWEDGKLKLSDPVSRYLPAFRSQTVREGNRLVPAGRGVTISDLLNMTSGMSYPCADAPEVSALFDEAMAKADSPKAFGTVDFISRLAEAPLVFQPGTGWRYGTSADVLGAAAEVISGMRFGDYLRRSFFEPLGMEDTGFYLPPEKKDRLATIYDMAPGKPVKPYHSKHLLILDYDREPAFQSGGGGLFSTADDYFRFTSMLEGEGTFGGRRYLRPETVRFLRTDRLTEQQRPYFNWPQMRGYGYGNLVRVLLSPAEAGLLSAPGEFGWDGWSGTFMEICPAERVQIILMTAQLDRDSTAVRREIRNAVFRQYL